MKCSKCGKEADKSLFTKSDITKDGKRGLCKQCKSLSNAKYKKNNKEKIAKHCSEVWFSSPEIRAKNKLYKELQRTGLNATEYVKNKTCSICGLTNDEHKIKYKERLHVHHENNTGRYLIDKGLKPDHSKLVVLCRSCHVSEDNKNRDYTGRGYKIWETRRRNEKNNRD